MEVLCSCGREAETVVEIGIGLDEVAIVEMVELPEGVTMMTN